MAKVINETEIEKKKKKIEIKLLTESLYIKI